MLVVEPVQASIWHCLNHYAYGDATFLAERLFHEVETEDALHLLATCHFRAGRIQQAHHLLTQCGARSPQNRFLLAKCAHEMGKLPEAEALLADTELGEAAAFGWQILASIYGQTERLAKAAECDKKALKLNPFLWKSFEALCNRGDAPDPAKAFTLAGIDSLAQCHGTNSILSLVNGAQQQQHTASSPGLQTPAPVPAVTAPPLATLKPVPNISVTSTPNVNPAPPPSLPVPLLTTPVLAATPIDNSALHTPMEMDATPINAMTPMANLNSTNRSGMSGIGTLNYTSDAPMSAPRPPPGQQGNAPPPLRRRIRPMYQPSPNSPYPGREIMADPQQGSGSNLPDDSFNTPSFGLLPRANYKLDTNCILRLDFSSPALSILSPMMSTTPNSGSGLGGENESPVLQQTPNDKVLLQPARHMRNIMSSKESPLKPNLSSQNQQQQASNQHITPSPNPNAAPRRSSRLYSSQQSVKENSKAPTKKMRAPKSPSRKTKPRGVLSTQADLDEKNEKNKADREKALISDANKEKHLSGDDDLLKPKQALTSIASAPAPAQVNLGAHALVIQKQSLEGLMQLLQQYGKAYSELAKFNCSKAVQLFDSIPKNHRTSGWTLGLIGKSHFELGDYKMAKQLFSEMRDREPHRLEFMEYFSTALWHLQDDVELSSLAQELTRISKTSPQAWCAAGNCFSHLKEHENAIKFFQRATQVDPNFAYAQTLLGHEYVLIEELEKALACFRTAVRMDPRHYNAWYGIGLTYYKQERFQLTDIYYRKALAINPTNPILMCHVAVVQHAMQKTERALETLNYALEQSPKNSLCKYERASILFSVERYQEALEELNDLKELAPKESPVYFLLGKVHNKLNNTHLALMHFSWAMDLDPRGANSQIKDALDPALNRAAQEDPAAAAINDSIEEDDEEEEEEEHEMMQTGQVDEVPELSESFPPDDAGEASPTQESLTDTSAEPEPSSSTGAAKVTSGFGTGGESSSISLIIPGDRLGSTSSDLDVVIDGRSGESNRTPPPPHSSSSSGGAIQVAPPPSYNPSPQQQRQPYHARQRASGSATLLSKATATEGPADEDDEDEEAAQSFFTAMESDDSL